MRAALELIGYTLKRGDIVLVRTGRDAFYGQPDYMFRGCAVTAEATRWLYDQGVRVMGIDAWGWDGPLDRQANEALCGESQVSSGPPTRQTWPTRRSNGLSISVHCPLLASKSRVFRSKSKVRCGASPGGRDPPGRAGVSGDRPTTPEDELPPWKINVPRHG